MNDKWWKRISNEVPVLLEWFTMLGWITLGSPYTYLYYSTSLMDGGYGFDLIVGRGSLEYSKEILQNTIMGEF